MRSRDVLEIVGRLESDGIRYWIDGGWGVDALLENETPDRAVWRRRNVPIDRLRHR